MLRVELPSIYTGSMSVENQMVADFYARLWLWIDHSQPQCVMLDDGGRGGEATPDLCICFLGSKKPLRIEFKVVNKQGQIDPTPKQLETWGEGSKARLMSGLPSCHREKAPSPSTFSGSTTTKPSAPNFVSGP